MVTPEQLIATEEEIRLLWEAGELPYLVHLQGGNEKEIIEIFKDLKPTDWVFASHRCHYAYLLHTYLRYLAHCFLGDSQAHDKSLESARESLIEKVKNGRSMFLYNPRFLCSAIVAGTASIAAGMALAIKRRGGSELVYAFIGDAGAEEGHFLEAVQFAWWHQLPVHFYIEDNCSSCGVTKDQRRNGSKWDWQYPPNVTRYEYTPTFPHAGSSVRPQLKWRAP